MLASAPAPAASDGVARPNRMAPSTEMISSASGKNEVASAQRTSLVGMSVCSLGSLGASAGLIMARAMM